ncbi:hypothetical protein CARUB_v10012431mg, partial [Capsella rubella]
MKLLFVEDSRIAGKHINVLLRAILRCAIYLPIADRNFKFGIKNEKAQPKELKLVGAHCHLGSTITKVTLIVDIFSLMVETIDHFRRHDFAITWVYLRNMGNGSRFKVFSFARSLL